MESIMQWFLLAILIVRLSQFLFPQVITKKRSENQPTDAIIKIKDCEPFS